MRMSDLVDCIETAGQTKAKLEKLEERLASQYGLNIRSAILRRTLLEMDSARLLADDSLLAEWQATYSRHQSWVEDSWSVDPKPKPAEPEKTDKQEAAYAASALLCVAVFGGLDTVRQHAVGPEAALGA
jgi:hypothetical protein